MLAVKTRDRLDRIQRRMIVDKKVLWTLVCAWKSIFEIGAANPLKILARRKSHVIILLVRNTRNTRFGDNSDNNLMRMLCKAIYLLLELILAQCCRSIPDLHILHHQEHRAGHYALNLPNVRYPHLIRLVSICFLIHISSPLSAVSLSPS